MKKGTEWLLGVLKEVQELIEDYADVTDGGPLGPNPNDAMRASQLIDLAFAADWDAHTPLPRVKDSRAQVEIASAADRAVAALDRAISEPWEAKYRCDISNALNYIETIVRQEKADA